MINCDTPDLSWNTWNTNHRNQNCIKTFKCKACEQTDKWSRKSQYHNNGRCVEHPNGYGDECKGCTKGYRKNNECAYWKKYKVY